MRTQSFGEAERRWEELDAVELKAPPWVEVAALSALSGVLVVKVPHVSLPVAEAVENQPRDDHSPLQRYLLLPAVVLPEDAQRQLEELSESLPKVSSG